MMALVVLLVGVVGADDLGFRPKPSPLPVIPIPTGGTQLQYRLYTDWTPVSHARPVWRSAKRLEDTGSWEESVVGRAGGRFRAGIWATDYTRLDATTGRRFAGDGGVGSGFEWRAYLGNSCDFRLEVEFTARGPRVVLGVTYWTWEHREYALGCSVLAGQIVYRHGWNFEANELQGYCYMPRLLVLFMLQTLRDKFK